MTYPEDFAELWKLKSLALLLKCPSHPKKFDLKNFVTNKDSPENLRIGGHLESLVLYTKTPFFLF